MYYDATFGKFYRKGVSEPLTAQQLGFADTKVSNRGPARSDNMHMTDADLVSAAFDAGAAIGRAQARLIRGPRVFVGKDGAEIEETRPRKSDPYVDWILDNCDRDGHVGMLEEHMTEAEMIKEKTRADEESKKATLAAMEAESMKRRATEKVYTFATAYGGVAHGSEPPQIHEKTLALRLAVGSLEAKRIPGGALFPVKSSKELMQKFGQALADLDLVFAPIQIESQVMENVEFSTKDGPKPGTGVHIRATYRLIAPDHSFIDVQGFGGGLDRDDKAGGKASTYCYKDAVLKFLGLPEKDLVDTDDESGHGQERVSRKRKEKEAPPTQSTQSTQPAQLLLASAIVTKTVDEYLNLLHTAPDGTTLVNVAAEARNVLNKDDQAKCGEAYRARKKELGIA